MRVIVTNQKGSCRSGLPVWQIVLYLSVNSQPAASIRLCDTSIFVVGSPNKGGSHDQRDHEEQRMF